MDRSNRSKILYENEKRTREGKPSSFTSKMVVGGRQDGSRYEKSENDAALSRHSVNQVCVRVFVRINTSTSTKRISLCEAKEEYTRIVLRVTSCSCKIVAAACSCPSGRRPRSPLRIAIRLPALIFASPKLEG